MTKEEALRRAIETELDLIEISPKANPPVAKIMSWSKYKYELDKKHKEQKKNKSGEMKEMWFKAFIQEGDLDHKLKKVTEFLKKKHSVKLQVRAKGRVNRQQMEGLIKDIINKLADVCEVEDNIRRDRFSITVIVRPKK
ncbi:MAG: translation initiation factor IF-3 [candidate division WS6 bacterium GW2011_GWA2_37_6]|uniref:Translation initiation factor IF-3 n=1 Tax=candidate division WS6 bacterium GW2011_GWA2_37_6 TaxID=1619087 RepID=A0A0G0HB52_9BACT|nr:MAG: translation initiation factor IF-3 [candidate division WS6 bacterium GW2011_GWA2_37_6]